MMDDAVAEGRGADGPALWVADLEGEKSPWLVASGGKLLLECQKLALQVKLEAGDGGPVAFTACRPAGRAQQVVEPDDPLEQPGLTPHVALSWRSLIHPPSMRPTSLISRETRS